MEGRDREGREAAQPLDTRAYVIVFPQEDLWLQNTPSNS